MGSKGGGKTQQTYEPWSEQAPYLQHAFGEAQRLYNLGGPKQYSGPTVAPLSSQTQQGLTQLEERVQSGSPVTRSAQSLATDVLSGRPQFMGSQGYLPEVAQNALQQTAGGQNLTGNPYLDQQFDHAAARVTDNFNRNVTPHIAAQFSHAGRAGSGAHASAIGHATGQVSDSLAGLANQIYGDNYQRERDRQLSAANQLGVHGLQAAGINAGVYGAELQQQSNFAGLANQLANQDFVDIGQLLSAGGLLDARAQHELELKIEQYNAAQRRPYENLARYIDAIQGTYGGGASSDDGGAGRTQNAIAGGTLGYQLGGPWGAAAGATLGYVA